VDEGVVTLMPPHHDMSDLAFDAARQNLGGSLFAQGSKGGPLLNTGDSEKKEEQAAAAEQKKRPSVRQILVSHPQAVRLLRKNMAKFMYEWKGEACKEGPCTQESIEENLNKMGDKAYDASRKYVPLSHSQLFIFVFLSCSPVPFFSRH